MGARWQPLRCGFPSGRSSTSRGSTPSGGRRTIDRRFRKERDGSGRGPRRLRRRPARGGRAEACASPSAGSTALPLRPICVSALVGRPGAADPNRGPTATRRATPMNVILRVTAGPHTGREYVFDRHDSFVVGRSSQVKFSVPADGFLSRNHFLIEFNPPACYLRDLGSTNGTRLNGLRVAGARLRDGDVISAGESTFVVRVEETRGEIPAIRCLGCERPAPEGVAVAARPGDLTIDWLCESCAAHRRKYPTPPPGYWIERLDRRRGDGRGLPREAALQQHAGGDQDDGPHHRRQRPRQGVLPARDGRGPCPSAPEHRRLLQHGGVRRPVPARHGARRRRRGSGVGRGSWESRCR